MKRSYIIRFAIILGCLVFSINAFADVKVKIRQTMSGQTYENTTYIKGKRQRTEQNMGGMQTVNLTQCDLRRSVQIMPQTEVYTITNWEAGNSTQPADKSKIQNPQTKTQNGGLVTTTYTIKDTGERKQMFGYTARHLLITMETQSSPDACSLTKSKIEFDGWYIDAAFALECEMERYSNYRSPQSKPGCQDRYEMKQIGTAKRGYPVYEKMTMFDESGKESMTMINEVIELSNSTLDAALFDIPQGYREVKDSTALYSSMSGSNSVSQTSGSSSSSSSSAMSQNVKNLSNSNLSNSASSASNNVGAKKEGVVRVGMAGVKTGSVGEGMNAAELAGAIQNTLSEYLKAPKIEVIPLESKLASAIDAEAKEKECDYVIYAQVSHKKGGGGFGMFKAIAPALGNVVPMAGMGGNIAGQVAGQVASQAIYTAAGMAGNVKSKDELTLDVKVNSTGGAAAMAKQYKAKAKSDGEDIISPMIEQAAQAILDAVTK